MFTGIVQEVGSVVAAVEGGLKIHSKRVLRNTKLGDSVCVNGVCLTIVEAGDDGITVNVVPETYSRTNLGGVKVGDAVNLEPAMQVGERLGGHIVQGHIDGAAQLVQRDEDGDYVLFTLEPSPTLMPFIVEKGSVTLDGVSLTVARRDDRTFAVALVPFTLQHTNFDRRKIGDQLNLEVDVLAKYVEQLLRPYAERALLERS